MSVKIAIIAAVAVAAAGLIAGCVSKSQVDNSSSTVTSFKQITQDEAKAMMEKDDGHIIVDVRRQDEYETGHIPGAICIPNESIVSEKPEELPDTDQIILVYCRSGRRSKEAAQKLGDMGYTNIYEFGGIMDWTGEIVTDSETEAERTEADELAAMEKAMKTAVLTYDSFDGGGLQYSVTVDDPEILTYRSERRYRKKDHEMLGGAGYDVVFTFSGAKEGETLVKISGRSPIIMDLDETYRAVVDKELKVTLTKLEDEIDPMEPVAILVIEIGNRTFSAELEANSSADALKEHLSAQPLELTLSDYGGFEKVGELPWSLPVNDSEITTEPGDIILYQGNKLSIYYNENTWSLTRLGRLNAGRDELIEALGDGDVTVRLWLEWSE